MRTRIKPRRRVSKSTGAGRARTGAPAGPGHVGGSSPEGLGPADRVRLALLVLAVVGLTAFEAGRVLAAEAVDGARR